MIKRILIGIGCLALVLSMSGCGSSNIDKTYSIDYEEMEVTNMTEDTLLYQDIKNVHASNLQKANNNDEKSVVNLKYIDDVYKMASNRFNLDVDIMTVYSEEYMVYVSMMQVFCETYMKEAETLVNNKKMYDLNYIRNNTATGYMLVQVEETMNTFLQAIDGGE